MGTKRIYFHVGHAVFILIVIVFFFFVYVLNDHIIHDEKDMSVISKVDTEKEYHQLNINDVNAFAKEVKLILKDRVNIVTEPKILLQSEEAITIQLDNYIVEANLKDCKLAKKEEIPLRVHQGENTLVEEIMMPIEFVDTQAPVITLNTNTLQLYEDEVFYGDDYIESISDNYDNEIAYELKNTIPISNGNLDVGNYEIIYECYDSSNNRGEAKLQVEVLPNKKEEPVLKEIDVNKSTLHKQVLNLLGKPYVWGGKGPNEFDCSGIIMYVYQLNGIALEWSDIQYGTGTSISLDPSMWQVGDVLSYCDSNGEIVHHALYLGNHKALHAITSGVSIIDIDTPLIGVDGFPEVLTRVIRFTDLFVN